eukprot:1151428-Pelagomonas_calceolata.AAC.1
MARLVERKKTSREEGREDGSSNEKESRMKAERLEFQKPLTTSRVSTVSLPTKESQQLPGEHNLSLHTTGELLGGRATASTDTPCPRRFELASSQTFQLRPFSLVTPCSRVT